MQANGAFDPPVLCATNTRRGFLRAAALGLLGAAWPGKRAKASSSGLEVDLPQIAYAGGNWQPYPTAMRRLAWELHKRTLVNTALEPSEIKPTAAMLSRTPLAFLCGDRGFTRFSAEAVEALSRFVRLGGTLVIDSATTPDGEARAFDRCADELLASVLGETPPTPIASSHVLYRTFYRIDRPMGRIEGPAFMEGAEKDGRLCVIRSRHDLGGALAKDNLGNWLAEVIPGGERQREQAFRLGINIVLYALCLDYKNEEPHRRFSNSAQ
jgi:hypothetical protein